MNTVSVRIESTGRNQVLKSNLHKELKSILESELDVPFESISVSAPSHTMSGELVVAIQSVSVMVSTLALIWAIIVTRYRCSVSIEVRYEDGTSLVIEKKALSEKRLQKEMAKLQEEIQERVIDKKVKEIVYRPES